MIRTLSTAGLVDLKGTSTYTTDYGHTKAKSQILCGPNSNPNLGVGYNCKYFRKLTLCNAPAHIPMYVRNLFFIQTFHYHEWADFYIHCITQFYT